MAIDTRTNVRLRSLNGVFYIEVLDAPLGNVTERILSSYPLSGIRYTDRSDIGGSPDPENDGVSFHKVTTDDTIPSIPTVSGEGLSPGLIFLRDNLLNGDAADAPFADMDALNAYLSPLLRGFNPALGGSGAGYGLYSLTGSFTILFANIGSVALDTIDDESQLPSGISTYYVVGTSRIQPGGANDMINVQLEFQTRGSVSHGRIAMYIDESALGNGSGPIHTKTFNLSDVALTIENQVYSVNVKSTGDFLTNGGVIYIQSQVGDTTIIDPSLTINRLKQG